MIYHIIQERAVTGADFKIFLKEIIECCLRSGITSPIFVMDSARIQHYKGFNEDENIYIFDTVSPTILPISKPY